MKLIIKRFLDHAHTAAKAGPGVGMGSFRLGAVLVANHHKIVAAGFNQLKTHPRLAEVSDHPYIHAETHAMFRFGLENCRGLDLYVVRIGRRGERRMAKPCSTCMWFITEYKIKDVYYSINSDNDKYGVIYNDW